MTSPSQFGHIAVAGCVNAKGSAVFRIGIHEDRRFFRANVSALGVQTDVLTGHLRVVAKRIARHQRAGRRNFRIAAGVDRADDEVGIRVGIAQVDIANSVCIDLSLGGVGHQIKVGAVADVDVALGARGGRAVHVDVEVLVVCANRSSFRGQVCVAAGSQVALRFVVRAHIEDRTRRAYLGVAASGDIAEPEIARGFRNVDILFSRCVKAGSLLRIIHAQPIRR